jgi:hypothetical protein
MVELKEEQHKEFNEKIVAIAKGVHCQVCTSLIRLNKSEQFTFQPIEDITANHSVATFVFNEPKA